jgi:hypothetical protein
MKTPAYVLKQGSDYAAGLGNRPQQRPRTLFAESALWTDSRLSTSA